MSASWINKLNESDSRLHKEAVLKEALTAASLGSENAHRFLSLTHVCYNPFITLNLRKVTDKLLVDDHEEHENPWEDFTVLLSTMASGNLTGNAAKDAVEEIKQRFSYSEWNTFCAPVIRRDLRAGVSSTTINKICKNSPYKIPLFACQLASTSDSDPRLLQGVKRLEPKLDGVRVLLTVKFFENQVVTTCYSRNGKQFHNFSEIERQISEIANSFISEIRMPSGRMPAGTYFDDGFVLDGEVVGESFQALMRQARRKENVDTSDSVFHVFDILPINDFKRGYWNARLTSRMAHLETLERVGGASIPNIKLVPHKLVELSLENGQEELDNYANEQVNAGFEGIMIKHIDAPYECKRNSHWVKWKPVYDYDLTVIGVEEGTGRNEGRMGALVCEGVDSDKHIVVNVGSGYTDEERQQYWDNKSDVIGKTAVILADAVTQNQNGTYSLRFPRFKTFRTDK